MKILLIAFVILSLAGCSSLRMTYKGEFKTADGKEGTVTAEKTYDLGDADSTLCAITAIFLGGYCWFYTVMPTTQQRQQMQSDVTATLSQNIKASNYTLTTLKNDKLNFEKGEDVFKINFQKNTPIKSEPATSN